MNLLLIISLTVLCHTAFNGVRVTISLFALSKGGSTFVVGSLMALMAAFPTVLGVAAGRWTDRIGSRRPILVGATLVVMGGALPALLPEVPVLYLSAALTGTGMMAAQVALQNAVGALSSVEDRAHNFSQMALGFSLSSFVGPFALMALLPLITILGIWLEHVHLPQPSPHAASHVDRNVFDLLKQREMRRVFIASSLLAMGWDLHTFFVPIIGTERGLTASQIGGTLSAFALATFIIRIAMRWIVRRFTEWQVLSSVMFLAGATYLLFPFVGSAWQLVLLSFMLGLGLGAAQPMVMSLLHHMTPEGRAGEALGLRTTLMNSGQVALPLVFGAVGAAVGLTTVFWSAALCLAAGGYFTRR